MVAPVPTNNVTKTTCPYCGVGCGVLVSTQTSVVQGKPVGEIDFDQLAKDLGLDSEELKEQREALKKALEEDPTAPLQPEEEGRETFTNLVLEARP